MLSRSLVLAMTSLLARAAAARADGHAHHHGGEPASGAAIAVSVGLIAADYHARLFEGSYRGAVFGVRGDLGRFGFAATVPVYQLDKNGLTVEGTGDVMLHAHASIARRGRWMTGAGVMASIPTSDGYAGLGMGHPMVMAESWHRWSARGWSLAGAVGYARALGGAMAHAEHGGGLGGWPLVEPMNASEVTARASAAYAIARTVAIGPRLGGATPLGDGQTRLSAGAELRWASGRVATSLGVDRGAVGAPFGTRAGLEVAVTID